MGYDKRVFSNRFNGLQYEEGLFERFYFVGFFRKPSWFDVHFSTIHGLVKIIGEING